MDIATLHRLGDFSCGIFFMFQFMGTLLLYLKGRTHRLQRAVFWLMLCLLGISAFEFYVFFIDNFLGAQLRPVTNMLQLMAVPLCLMVIYTVTHDRSMPWPWGLANSLPYVVVLLVYLLTYSQAVYYGLILFAAIHAAGIIVYGFIAIRQYNKTLLANISADSRYSVNWLRYMLFLYIGLAVVWSIATLQGSQAATITYNLLCVIIFSMLCYFVYRQENMLDALSASTDGDDNEQLSDLAPDSVGNEADDDATQQAYHFADRFEMVFNKGKIYLNATLTLNDLARELGTNRTYLPNYLNRELHTTFYEYVNQWRVRRAKELMRETDMLLEEVALQSGFNSMSSFRRYFSAHTGMSPLEYRKQERGDK
jgi:AraC-like DNA-binding protein